MVEWTYAQGSDLGHLRVLTSVDRTREGALMPQKKPMELNPIEADVLRVRDQLVADGIEQSLASRYVLNTHPKATKKFVEFLTDGALTKVDGKVVETSAA